MFYVLYCCFFLRNGGALKFQLCWNDGYSHVSATLVLCNSLRDVIESDDDFSEEDDYIPPSDDGEATSVT